jgi:hypothetical protein
MPAPPSPSNRYHSTFLWLGLVLFLLFTYALRIYRLDAVDLRGDEAFTVIHWTTTPFSEKWIDMLGDEAHPVGAFMIYWFWKLIAGDSVFAMRLLPLFSNLVGGATIIVIARRFFKDDWLLVAMAAFLWALNPFLIWHAQDARNYALVTAIAPLSIYWLLRAIQHPHTISRWQPWWPYIVLQTLGIYLYFFEAFTLTVQIAFVLLLGNRQLIKQAFKAWVIIGILCIPVAIQVYWLVFISDYQGTATYAEFSALFEHFIPTLLLGNNTFSILPGLLFIIVLSGGLLLLIPQKRLWAILLLVWIILPLALIFTVSNWSSVFRPRYVIHVVPALILSILGLSYFLGQRYLTSYAGTFVALGTTLVLGTISAIEVYDYYVNDSPKAPEWRELTEYIEAYATDDSLLISGSADPALEYYFDGNIYFIPTDRDNFADDFPSLLQDYDRFFILTGEQTGSIYQYLENHTQHIPGDRYPGVIQFRTRRPSWDEIAQPTNIRFGDVALLRGYTLSQGKDDTQTLFLYWEALKQTPGTEHSVLVHITAEVGGVPVVEGYDHGIAGLDHSFATESAIYTVSTQNWVSGALYRDPIPLPTDLPPGDYIVHVGMYETATIQKLPLTIPDDEKQYDGRYPLVRYRVN